MWVQGPHPAPETRYAQSLPTRVQRHLSALGKVFRTLACLEEKCILNGRSGYVLDLSRSWFFQESKQDKLGPESRRARLRLSWGARLGTLCARLITFDCQRHVGDSQDWLGRPAELRKLGPDPLGLA